MGRDAAQALATDSENRSRKETDSYNRRTTTLIQEAAQWRETAQAYNQQVEALRSSTSWKLSAPVRWVGKGGQGLSALMKSAARPLLEASMRLSRTAPWIKVPILGAANLIPPVRRKIDHFWSVRQDGSSLTLPQADLVSEQSGTLPTNLTLSLRPRAAEIYQALTTD